MLVSDKEVPPAVLDTPRRPANTPEVLTMKSLAHPAHEPTTRIERGRKLYAEHGAKIWFDRRLRCWIVPSENDLTSIYEVHLGREEECECRDFEIRHPEGGCKHIVAATLRKAKTFKCEGCGDRRPNRERIEVHAEHVAYGHVALEGARYCRPCAHARGVL